MATQIVPHRYELSAAVAEFNKRMYAGGSRWGFYTEPVPDWIPKRPGSKVWREYYLVVEDGETVRGGYALKPQEWLIRGEKQIVTDWQGPFTEGAVAPKYGTLGLRCLRDMQRRQPLLYSWGHGGDDEPIVQLLRKMDWLMHPTPFCLRILQPARFMRMNAYLRTSLRNRLALDTLAFSGLGNVGVRAMHAALRMRAPRPFFAKGEVVGSFGPWADELWERSKGDYAAIAVRDADAMNTLMPGHGFPPGIRLKVSRRGQVIGWAALMDTAMRGDHRFGDLRVGSVVDVLARLDDAPYVVAAATRELARRGVDIIVSNQAHPRWADAFAANGYVVLPNRRLFAASPALKQALEPFEETSRGLHLTNMDGHGPMAL